MLLNHHQCNLEVNNISVHLYPGFLPKWPYFGVLSPPATIIFSWQPCEVGYAKWPWLAGSQLISFVTELQIWGNQVPPFNISAPASEQRNTKPTQALKTHRNTQPTIWERWISWVSLNTSRSTCLHFHVGHFNTFKDCLGPYRGEFHFGSFLTNLQNLQSSPYPRQTDIEV